MTVYIVRFDHSDYGQGIIPVVFWTLEGARAAVREDHRLRFPEDQVDIPPLSCEELSHGGDVLEVWVDDPEGRDNFWYISEADINLVPVLSRGQ